MGEGCESSEAEGRHVRMQCDEDVGGSADTTDFTHMKHHIVKSRNLRLLAFRSHLSSHIFTVHRSAPRPHSAADVLFAIMCCPVTPGTELPHVGTSEGEFFRNPFDLPCVPIWLTALGIIGKVQAKLSYQFTGYNKIWFGSFTHIAASYIHRQLEI